MKRRDFIKQSAIAGAGTYAAGRLLKLPFVGGTPEPEHTNEGKMTLPVVISTWNFGIKANDAAWKVLSNGGNSLDAVEQGVRVIEDDPTITSVGYGGLPDEEMKVTLDACIMDWRGNCGAVGCLENIKNPISVARKVMERTKHVMLVGDGAYKFAIAQGFQSENLLTEQSKEQWLKWKERHSDNWLPVHDMNDLHDNHDTIGMISVDSKGRISGAVTTSGLAWKIHGRVGDSGIVGAGLYVDGDVGAAASTGLGEANMRILGSYLVVEGMRNGMTPQQACENAVRRAIEYHSKMLKADWDGSFQLAYIAMNTKGDVGGAAIRKGFQYALCSGGINKLYDAKYLYQ
jgi:N4-(beta-N-acetylglucosaminyl)-L-asparaginase